MRHTLRALIAMWFVATTAAVAVGEPGWWPFGREAREENELSAPSDDAGVTSSRRVQPREPIQAVEPDDNSNPNWMIDSEQGKVSWPRLRMPKFPKPRLTARPRHQDSVQAEGPRNTWMEETPEEVPPSPLQAMKNGARRVSHGTRAAWNKTVDVLTPGESLEQDSTSIARRPTERSWWHRMIAPAPEPQGPQTVTEWMAQDRLDP